MHELVQATKHSFRTELEHLVANFRANEPEYTSPGYPEAQARTDFISPFFRALRWDVENRAGLPYTQRDVIEEKGPGEGRPDYTFRIGGIAKFFIEAKAPHEDLQSERHILQVKRYAWSTKEVFAVILTDFDEFRFYDASQEPDQKHPHRGELLHLRYTEYLDNADKLWEFSRERVAAGSVEALLPRDKLSLRFRKPPDEKFLEDMTRWRAELARAVFKRNPRLDPSALTEIVQRLLDRLIFIRVAEDRRIISTRRLLEREQEWMAIGGRRPLLPMLNELFHEVNQDFNGDIFKPHACEAIALDDWALGRIIEELYPPRGPYRFDAIPVDIFGAVYERYLGKMLRPRGKQVVVEDKPEVRKAGGVYYTPKYIVDYIVANTVGKVIEGKTPKDIEKVRILDPACGSGSFLIGAFQSLIDYHVAYYEKHLKEAHTHPLYPELISDGNGGHRLSIWRKAKILSHNLYGVDLDPQAVEITMMNLYLKALEGERDLPQKQHLLPELKFNIRCGNSLIAPDIAGEQELSPEELERLRPFDWHSKTDGFGDILGAGGFDAVIGNPPYRMLQPHNTSREILAHLRSHYLAAEFKIDLFHLFLQRAVGLLKERGYVSYILPTTILNNVYAESLRRWIMDRCCMEQIAVARGRVFADADVHTCILVLRRETSTTERENQKVQTTSNLSEHFAAKPSLVSRTRQVTFAELPGRIWNILVNEQSARLLSRLSKDFVPLEKVGKINRGLITGNREKYFANTKKTDHHVRIIAGSDVHRYHTDRPSEYVFFRRPKTAGGCWDEEVHFAPHKIVVRQICEEPTASILRRPLAVTGNIFTVRADSLETELYLLGILNSRLTGFFWRVMFADFKTSFPQVTIFSLAQVPIRVVDLLNLTEKGKRDQIVVLVDSMLTLHTQLAAANSEAQKGIIQRQIDATDAAIDRLVYDLYGLTAEEIALVERSLKPAER